MNRSHVAILTTALASVSTITAVSAQTALPQQAPRTVTQSATVQLSVQEINDGFVQKITSRLLDTNRNLRRRSSRMSKS